MKVTYAVKKLSKLGEVRLDDCGYSAVVSGKEGKKYVVSFRRNGGGSENVVCLKATRLGDVMDSQTDYFPGRYFDSFNQVLSFLAN